MTYGASVEELGLPKNATATEQAAALKKQSEPRAEPVSAVLQAAIDNFETSRLKPK
jgi:hypothetical protein